MSHAKIKGKAWCQNCCAMQDSMLLTMTQKESGYEIQGYCLTCEGFVCRTYEQTTQPQSEQPSEPVIKPPTPSPIETQSPPIVHKVRRLELLLKTLCVSILMLFIDRFII